MGVHMNGKTVLNLLNAIALYCEIQQRIKHLYTNDLLYMTTAVAIIRSLNSSVTKLREESDKFNEIHGCMPKANDFICLSFTDEETEILCRVCVYLTEMAENAKIDPVPETIELLDAIKKIPAILKHNPELN